MDLGGLGSSRTSQAMVGLEHALHSPQSDPFAPSLADGRISFLGNGACVTQYRVAGVTTCMTSLTGSSSSKEDELLVC